MADEKIDRIMPDKKACSILFFLLILLFSFSAQATVQKKLSLTELTGKSAVVAVGRVVDLHYLTVDSRVWTIVTVVVETPVKGRGQNSVKLRIPGGMQTINGRTLVTRVEGTPELTRLQRGVFFLNGKAPAYFDLVGWNQGFWKVETQNGQEVVTASSQETDASAALPLDRFLNEIRNAVREK